jgi:hypothetical protein
MDGSRFDDLTRTLVKSRRGVLRTLQGGALAALTGLGRHSATSATPWAFYRVNQSCKNGESCGTLAPCTDGICRPLVCKIDGQIYQPGEFEPENLCHICDPTVGPSRWQQWTPAREGEGCAFAVEEGCDPVFYHCTAGTCLPDPDLGQALPGGFRCKRDEQCCHGVCCQDVCCPADHVCAGFGCVRIPPGDDQNRDDEA